MFDLFLAFVAAVAPAGTAPPATVLPTESASSAAPAQAPSGTVNVGEGVVMGGNTFLQGVPSGQSQTAQAPAALPTFLAPTPAPAPAAPGLVAEPQTPTGKFTTATEVKPILTATKGNWVAVREFDGKDLVYVTHLWAWRCGLLQLSISVNDEPMQNWPLPPCHLEYATPNAVLEGDGLPYLSMRLKSVDKVTIQITYDDLSTDMAEFQRGQVLIP